MRRTKSRGGPGFKWRGSEEEPRREVMDLRNGIKKRGMGGGGEGGVTKGVEYGNGRGNEKKMERREWRRK